ncbi:rod-binding protein [Bombella mellum]|uniref:Chemotaxis protein n=1 Tax=Bombella mellum TaxID=2039288 RepID=A0ABR5ZT78_9PROT|nr:rod-binding protein [Bombella mellum]MBA5727452.1 chemotaxis protein [Bombella mellum]
MSVSSASLAASALATVHAAARKAAPSRTVSPQDDARIRRTARDFEAMALGEMLQPMFDTVDNSDAPFGGGNAEKQFRSMQVLELGKEVARGGGVGIAHQVYGRMKEMQEKASRSGNETGGKKP